MLKESIRKQAEEMGAELTAIRRSLHANPELSFQENHTADFIGRILDSWEVIHERTAVTGITGVVQGRSGGSYVVLRAEMDALPVEEANETEYRSVQPGIMHACGHDVHMACLLGAIRILAMRKQDFTGTVRFLFQPGEELLPGGAEQVLKSGLLDRPEPDFILAQHVYPELPAGHFGFRAGPYMASTDEVYIEVRGTGGHAALPHRMVDPVLIASHIVVALQQVISRKIPPDVPAVLSFGKFDARGTTNVIPAVAHLEGTFRIMDENWRKAAHEEIRRTATGVAKSMGAEVECRIVEGYPSLSNDPELTQQAVQFAREYAGADRIEDIPARMTGEDFARYALRFPALFYRLGTSNGTHTKPVHHPEFDVDESAIPAGTGMMAYLALRLLGSK